MISAQFSRYVVVGGISAAVDVAALWALLQLAVPRALAVAIAMAAGMVVNYALHHRFTFRSSRAVGARSVALYLAAVAGNYLLTLALIEIGVRFGLGVIAAKILSLPVIAATGFLFTRRFVF